MVLYQSAIGSTESILEHAMRKWKLRLPNESLRVGQDTITRSTNLRYAEDLMILATSREELVFMVETLAQEFSFIGLQLTGTKTKVLTPSPLQKTSHVEICRTVVAILHGETTHKYSGRKFLGDLNIRTGSGTHVSHTKCMGQISSAQIDIVEQTRVPQIENQIISCNCFSDCNAWFGVIAADAKVSAQIGRGTTADVEVYCWLGSHT